MVCYSGLTTLLFVSFLFENIAKIGLPNIFVYGFFIFLTVYSYSELIDKSKFAVLWESLRLGTVTLIIVYYGDWFGLNNVIPIGNYVIFTYLILSFTATVYFVRIEFKNQPKPIYNS